MEELKNKVFLVKVPKEIFDYVNESKESKVGHLEVFLNKKRKNKPEYKIKFNKNTGPKNFSLFFNKTTDYFYFIEQKKEEDMKITNIDNFGKLIVSDENESIKLIENIYNRETNKSKEIQVKQIKDQENKYKHSEAIQLTGNKYVDRDKKEKRVRKENSYVEAKIRELIPNNKYISHKEIADLLDVPEKQVKEILDQICDLMVDDANNRKKFYKLKDL